MTVNLDLVGVINALGQFDLLRLAILTMGVVAAGAFVIAYKAVSSRQENRDE